MSHRTFCSFSVTSKLSRNLRNLLHSTTNLRLGFNGTPARVVPSIVASVTVTLVLLTTRWAGWLQSWELSSFDQLIRWRGAQRPDSRLLIVTVTEADIQNQAQWPLSDRVIAQLLAKLQADQPKVIGLNVYRNLPQEPGHKELVSQLQAPNVIATMKIGDKETPAIPPPPSVPMNRVGFNDLLIDPDGAVRRNLMFITQPDSPAVFSFSVQLVLFYLQDQAQPKNSQNNKNLISWGNAVFLPLNAHDGGYSNIDDKGYQILLNYRSPRQIAQQVTLSQVLRGQVEPSWIKDKIILIGTTAPSAKDLYFTPYSASLQDEPKMAGVTLQAQMVSQILGATIGDQNPHATTTQPSNLLPNSPISHPLFKLERNPALFWFWPEWAEIVWIGVWAITGAILAWRFQHPARLALAGGIGLVALFGVSFGLLILGGWVPLVAPAFALLVTGACVVAEKQLYDAFHDSLTGLPNRALFADRVERSIRNHKRQPGELFAVLFLDLDRFKVINDSLGHLAGDELLIAIVARLKSCMRATDLLARVGGDDFAILLEEIKETANATQVAERIHKALILPFNLGGQEVFMTVSIGIALSDAEDERPEYLLRDAHTAMYRAKALGTGRYQVFDTAMHALAVERLQLETDLRMAIKRLQPPELCEFAVHYQPFVSLKTGKIIGFEALLRWHHPSKEMIFPVKFIPVAEETGLIVPLGEWVLREACWQLQAWQKQFPTTPPLMMSVNLSGKQFSEPNLIQTIQQILQEAGIAPDCLKLEITESVVMDDVESAIEVLKEMKALNVQLGIDDFGTGYSSLSYLSRFPTDTLKVDKSFVGRMEVDHALEFPTSPKPRSKHPTLPSKAGDNIAIVRTIIMLAHALGMDVIAEGVETAEQLTMLRSLGCEYGQGYFFSKPLPSDVMEAVLKCDPEW